MSNATDLLTGAAATVVRYLSNADYTPAAEYVLSLDSPQAIAYVVAVVVEGLAPARSRPFVAALTEAVNKVPWPINTGC